MRWKSTWIPLFFFLFLFPASPVPAQNTEDLETFAGRKAHHLDGGFVNPWRSSVQPGFVSLLKWKLASNPYAREKDSPPRFQVIETHPDSICGRGDSITYFGHATLWIRLGGCSILTDPVFGDIWPNIRRNTPFPLSPEALPRFDVVLITHSHYDHLDKDSIRRLGTGPVYIVPLGYRDWFEDVVPGAKVIELDWFETAVERDVLFRLVPSQHWTRRNLVDSNKRLWGSWIVEAGARRVFFCGDSGYFRGFEEFGRKYGPFDAAILPIAVNEPRWFMQAMHMDTKEALFVFRELRAKVLIPEQWGTFDLTDEPLDLPPKVYRGEAKKAGYSEKETPLLRHGETWFFPTAP